MDPLRTRPAYSIVAVLRSPALRRVASHARVRHRRLRGASSSLPPRYPAIARSPPTARSTRAPNRRFGAPRNPSERAASRDLTHRSTATAPVRRTVTPSRRPAATLTPRTRSGATCSGRPATPPTSGQGSALEFSVRAHPVSPAPPRGSCGPRRADRSGCWFSRRRDIERPICSVPDRHDSDAPGDLVLRDSGAARRPIANERSALLGLGKGRATPAPFGIAGDAAGDLEVIEASAPCAVVAGLTGSPGGRRRTRRARVRVGAERELVP